MKKCYLGLRLHRRREPGRRFAGKLAEFAHQMRLVGITAIGGDAGPVVVLSLRQRKRAVEAHDARQGLRADADCVGEFCRKVLAAPADLAGERRNAGAAARRDDRPVGPGYFGRQRIGFRKAGSDKSFGDVEAPVPIRRVAEPFAQRDAVKAQRIVQPDHAVPQLAHRQAEEAPRAKRREIDLDTADATEGFDHDRPGKEAGGEAGVAVIVAGRVAEPDGEGLGEADHQRHGQRSIFDDAEMTGAGLAIAADIRDDPCERGRGLTPHHLEMEGGRAVILAMTLWLVGHGASLSDRVLKSKAPGRAGRSELPEIADYLGSGPAHQTAGGEHDIGDEHDPNGSKRNECKNAKRGEKANDGDDQ
ncbi:hypothetical protein MPL3356_60170 [Mesorhizobium plurifarium]|uniref:Uncharacterized protein n=1 Tax=Mesorhizobium plurifarium TaxID=69974 RepID=A0A090E882_MESPL|nr:hypothetical protein MPL3356_60170 [Mesorhizobium plurifarium]